MRKRQRAKERRRAQDEFQKLSLGEGGQALLQHGLSTPKGSSRSRRGFMSDAAVANAGALTSRPVTSMSRRQLLTAREALLTARAELEATQARTEAAQAKADAARAEAQAACADMAEEEAKRAWLARLKAQGWGRREGPDPLGAEEERSSLDATEDDEATRDSDGYCYTAMD